MASNLYGNSIILTETIISQDSDNKTNISSVNNNETSIKQTKPSLAKLNTESAAPSIKPTAPAQQNSAYPQYKLELVWRNIIAFVYLHVGAVYGLYLMFTAAKGITSAYGLFLGVIAAQGITAGAHRLWAHRSYKAKWPMRFVLMILQTLAFQNCIHEWVRDHRVHHKFTDTDADPHNSARGFFFSHIGWLMVKKHPHVKSKGKTVFMDDLEEDPIVMFQKKYYLILMPIITFVIPTMIPMYFWGETFSNSWYVATVFRYTFGLNGTWLVNSAAHIWGMKPYDKSISPRNNSFVGVIAMGEGWHNYHHVFPWDYKTSELGNYSVNLTKAFIDFFSKIGWAYDLKTVSDEMIRKRVLRTGDGSHLEYGKSQELQERYVAQLSEQEQHGEEMVWGWDDTDMSAEDRMDAKILLKAE